MSLNQRVAPEPGNYWFPTQPLPVVVAPQAPESVPTAAPLSLAELTEVALRNNPRTRQSWFAARAAAAGVGIELADRLPTISGVVNGNRTQSVSATTGAVVPAQTRYGPTVSFTYILFDFGLTEDQIVATEYRLLSANLSHNRTLQDVIFQVEQAYYRLLGSERLVRVNETSLKNNQTALDAAQRRRDSGLATVADVYRAETQVAQSQLNLIRSKGEFEKARGQLAVTVGIPVDGMLKVRTLDAPPQVHEITESMTSLLDRAKAGRPDLVAAEAQARAARATAKATSKAGLPSIEVSGSQGRVYFNDGRPSVDTYTLALNLRIPIFSGFRDTYTVRQAEAQSQQAEAARDALYRQTELDVWQSYYDLQSSVGVIASTESQVKSAEQTAQATLARYQTGFGSILDLLTAQQDESNARVQRIQSYLDWFSALARLTFAIGQTELMVPKEAKK